MESHHIATGALPGSLSRWAALMFAGISMFGAHSVRAQGATPVATPVTSGETAFLFVLSGNGAGSLVANAGGGYRLTLLDAPTQTVFLSDRPQRVAGATSTARFLAGITADAGDPPNAALVIQIDAGEAAVTVFELTAPVYDAAANTFTCDVTVLEGFEQFASSAVGFNKQPMDIADFPAEFGPCSLFVDDIHWNPGGF